MAHSAICPRCSIAIDVPESAQYTSIECPNCRHLFSLGGPPIPDMELRPVIVPPRPPNPKEEEEILTVLPAPPATPPPLPEAGAPPEVLPTSHQWDARAGNEYSRAERRAFEEFDGDVPNKETAQRLLAYWKEKMPEVESAYKPSGVLPISALLLMIVGTFIAVATALVAEAAVGALAAGIIAILTLCNALAMIGGVIFCFWIVVSVIATVVALVAPFAAGGWAAAKTTTLFGRWGKNRNTIAASVFSMLAAGISIPIVCVLFVIFAKPPLDRLELFGLQPPTLQVIYWIVAVVGGLVTVGTAWFVALTTVESAKFCEQCERYMQKDKLITLHVDGLMAIVQAIAEKKPAAAQRALEMALGDHGEVLLFQCPECTEGYLEVFAHFQAQWRVKTNRLFKPEEDRDMKESWLAGSMQMSASDSRGFQM